MGTAVRKLEIRIDQTGDAKKGMKGLSGGLGALAGPAGMAAAAIAAVGAASIATGAKLISMGSEAEEMQGKFDVVFGESAPNAARELNYFGNIVGRSKFELMTMAASMQDMLVPMGFARDEAATLSVSMTQLAVDVASFNNVSDADVQRDFASALTGSHETVKKYGILINKNTLDLELNRMGVEGGMKAATEQEKVQARLNLIIAGTSDAYGDAARTSGSWANQMRALKSEISEAATTIGLELLPFVTPLLKIITDLARTALPPLLEGFKEVAGHLRTEFGPVIKELIAAFREIFESLGMNTGEVDVLRVTLDVLKGTISLVAHVLSGLANWLSHVAHGVRTLADAVGWLIGRWNDMKRAARDAINAIPGWLRPGSPTPFEIGLRGIGSAMDDLDFGKMAPAPGGPAMAGAGAGGGITVNLTYSPTISLADRYEATERLAPFIAGELRRLGVVSG